MNAPESVAGAAVAGRGRARSRPSVEVERVTKVFDGGHAAVTALDDVSVTIAENEFFTLLGPSGCGKTTLLRLIAGFDQPTKGRILLGGEPISHLPPYRRPVNTVFQSYALFPHMSVAQNIGFGLEMLGKSKAEVAETTREMLDLVKMEDFAARRSAELSGGQQQRVALARALAPHPNVLLLDEPLSALDLKLRQAMRGELKALQRETGITFIFVTHDQEEALTMSDRVAVMSEGQVQQVGTPLEIYERPINRFVSDFIGDTNFLEATIHGVDGDEVACRAGGDLEFKLKAVGEHGIGDRVTLALRPEKVALARTEADSASQVVGRVEEIIYLGTDTSYRVRLGDGTDVLARDQNSTAGESRFNEGEAVALRIASGSVRMLVD